MTFDQLEYFMSCASCLNFSLAAKYHYVSVSTLSRNISALEDELGVKLFERGYHGHRLTDEGVRFFNFAESTCNDLLDFWIDMEKRGIKPNQADDALRIACYPFDNLFSKIIECFSQLPSDYFGKKYKVHFISPGTMIKSVREGRVQLGIASAPELEHYVNDFFTIPFVRTPLCLRVNRGDLLFSRDEIKLSELFEIKSKFSDYLPEEFLSYELKNAVIGSEADLALLAGITHKYLPELIWNSRDKIRDKCLIMSSFVQLPPLDRKAVPISGSKLTMDFLFFGKKDNSKLAQEKIRIMREYISYIGGK